MYCAAEADAQREAAVVQSRRASELMALHARATQAFEEERKEKEQLAQRVTELEKRAAEVGQKLGCDAAKAPCDLLELLRGADEKRDRQANGRAQELRQIRDDHEQQVRDLTAVQAQQVERLAADHAAKVAGLEEAHVQAVQTLETAHNAALEAKKVENAKMQLEVYAAVAKVRDAAQIQEAAEAKVQACTKDLETAREQLAANAQLRDTAHSDRLKVDACARQLHEAMHLDGAVFTDACEVMKAAAAQIRDLRPVQQKSAEVHAQARNMHANLKALRAALGCGDQEQDCAGRASGLLALLRPAGSFVDPVARAKELVEMEAAVNNMLPPKAMADRSSLQHRLKAWASTSLANVRNQREEYKAAGAAEIVKLVATLLNLPARVTSLKGAELSQELQGAVKAFADQHQLLLGAVQKVALAIRQKTSLASTADGVRSVVDEIKARLRLYDQLVDVALRAARAAGLIGTDDDLQGWQVAGNEENVRLEKNVGVKNGNFKQVLLDQLRTKLDDTGLVVAVR
jgi:hypothetical protein